MERKHSRLNREVESQTTETVKRERHKQQQYPINDDNLWHLKNITANTNGKVKIIKLIEK